MQRWDKYAVTKNYNKHGSKACSDHIVRESELSKFVLNKIISVIDKVKKDDLYSMVRIEDIDEFNKVCGLERIKIVAADGASNYIRVYLNKLSEEEFKEFINYHLTTCERSDLLGASAHLLDIVTK